ncbi:hypothetical protein [Chitinophaga arvensicola]|uniref:DUF4919 domain-containing protein n=1 Tax=Chitinophaga arvensicola TaxID=29529 RepID=A0A1I0SB29_9BACT|nr:hypothetical protein [Chitinophaga arvensicola]SEW53854.1 hypothetical protein SAMN04488122_5719 [Chitinophaga arvensicola]
MKKIVAVLVLVAAYSVCFAQDDYTWVEPSKESQAYHEYRMKISRPPDGLQKVLGMISKIQDNENEALALSQKEYMSLSLREKLTYHLIHAETYSQNCDARPPVPDEHMKIFGQLPDAFGDYSWSQRQGNFMIANRDTVIALVSASIIRSSRVGLNYKKAIIDINAREMIPLLIKTYNKDHKDHDILTLLMILMKNNEFEPFMTSTSYKKLYANEETSYEAYLNFNSANEALIIERATNFYNGLPKKG